MNRILIGLVCLLTFATSASAECAWVVWRWHFVAGVNEAEPLYEGPEVAFPTIEMCLNYTRSRDFSQGHFYQCWPDTVDPRWPKGK